MDKLSFECRRCGTCCTGDGWLRKMIRPGDVQRWREEGRDDILAFVCECCNRLVDPEQDNAPWAKRDCPFLERTDGVTRCRIHETRPAVCREFPVRRCTNPKCPETYHLHDWLWQGKCDAGREFRNAMVRAVASRIQCDGE